MATRSTWWPRSRKVRHAVNDCEREEAEENSCEGLVDREEKESQADAQHRRRKVGPPTSGHRVTGQRLGEQAAPVERQDRQEVQNAPTDVHPENRGEGESPEPMVGGERIEIGAGRDPDRSTNRQTRSRACQRQQRRAQSVGALGEARVGRAAEAHELHLRLSAQCERDGGVTHLVDENRGDPDGGPHPHPRQ